MAFHKKGSLKIEDMVKSPWVYRQVRNSRGGIEAGISCLKRPYGLARCIWRGLDHFRAYVWSSVLAYNLAPANPPDRRLAPGRHHRTGPASRAPNRRFRLQPASAQAS